MILTHPKKIIITDMAKVEIQANDGVSEIRTERISCSREHGKLCSGQPEIFRAYRNQLALPIGRGRFPPKSETV